MQLENQYKIQLNEQPTPGVVEGFAEKILPSFLPLVDRYFDLEEKKLQRMQTQPQTRQPVAGKILLPQKFRPAPVPGTEQFAKYLNYLDQLNDTAFTRELVYLKHNQPDVYSAVLDDEMEEENFETNEE